jgi:hypothetical protein
MYTTESMIAFAAFLVGLGVVTYGLKRLSSQSTADPDDTPAAQSRSLKQHEQLAQAQAADTIEPVPASHAAAKPRSAATHRRRKHGR